jgi:transposase
MPKPYSVDLRERAVAAYDAGRLQTEVAHLFKLSLASLKRWLAQRRAGQGLAPQRSRRPGPRGAFGSPEAWAALRAQLQAAPDERLIDHCQRWQERTGQAVSVAALHRARRALGWRQKKKKLTASERDEEERAAWRQAHADLKPTDLVFVDESGSNLALAQRYGWALRGQRAWGQAPLNRGKNTPLFAAMTHEGLLASMTVEGAANTEAFLTYLDQVLCPALRPGRVVVLDNLQVHKAEAVRERIEACGCRRLFLPRYSPDFNPIEGAFSKLKTFLRRVQARTREGLEVALGEGLHTITAQDARGWFEHCGYPLTAQPS